MANIPEPEVSATQMREMTRALPDINNMSEPRCYEQCVEAPPSSGNRRLDDDTAKGQGAAY